MDASLGQRIADSAPLARAICRALQDQLTALGISDLRVADPGSAHYALKPDRATG
jgi:hypothetical protein